MQDLANLQHSVPAYVHLHAKMLPNLLWYDCMVTEIYTSVTLPFKVTFSRHLDYLETNEQKYSTHS